MSELIEVRRKEFEAWARDTFYSGLAFPSATWSESRSMYNDPGHHMAFKAWQASRAALCVELPKEDERGRITYTSAMRAIHAAGIKTKVKA